MEKMLMQPNFDKIDLKIEKPESLFLNEILGFPYEILDHGFIRVVDYMGNDSTVVNAARVSYGEGTKQVNENRGLIRYLLRHQHMTPFEMCEISFHVKCPIFVARQWIRHRSASVNEYSGRYSIMSDDFYVPALENIKPQSKDNKQGRSGELSERNKEGVQWLLHSVNEDCSNTYHTLLGEDLEEHRYDPYSNVHEDQNLLNEDFKGQGIARELARLVLPVSNYTQFQFKIDLRNLLNFLYLRNDSHAQYEIREYAKVICHIVEKWCPLVYEAFEDYYLEASKFSKIELQIFSDLCTTETRSTIHAEKYGISKGEFNEFIKKINEKNLFQEKV
jgi:thymidylate synthase (FAD)